MFKQSLHCFRRGGERKLLARFLKKARSAGGGRAARSSTHASPRAGPPRHRVLVLLGGAAARAAGAPRAAHLLIALSCPPQGSRRAHIPAAVQRHGQSAASPCLSLLPGPPGTHGLRRCCSTRSADAPQPLRPQRQLVVRPVSACQSRRCHLHAFGPPGPSRGSP